VFSFTPWPHYPWIMAPSNVLDRGLCGPRISVGSGRKERVCCLDLEFDPLLAILLYSLGTVLTELSWSSFGYWIWTPKWGKYYMGVIWYQDYCLGYTAVEWWMREILKSKDIKCGFHCRINNFIFIVVVRVPGYGSRGPGSISCTSRSSEK
jgi:hypothetical protein